MLIVHDSFTLQIAYLVSWLSMSTLQRSSQSFRRQGSSGRIWENGFQIPDRNVASGPPTPRDDQKENQDNKVAQDDELAYSVPVSKVHCPLPSVSPKSGNKVKKCGFVSIFGPCTGSPRP